MIHFSIYKNIKDLPEEWNKLAAHDIFLQSNYFEALKKSSPSNISWFYIGIYKRNELVGMAVVQRVELYLEDMFRNHKDSCYRQKFKHFVSKFLRGNMLVVGNLMHTGQHGIYSNSAHITDGEFLSAVYKGLMELKHTIKTDNKKRIRVIMLKDYFTSDAIHSEVDFFSTNKFHKVSVQPNMIMEVRPHWQTLDDYLSDLNKKYRQRLKVARKKSSGISKRELQLEEIRSNSSRLHELYKTISDNAKLNTFILPANHFVEMKDKLHDKFKVFGYFIDDCLIGFYSLILNHDTLETYFLGYDEEHQHPNQLYLNMLYDMTQYGIEKNFKSIVFARTAMEIKSAVGAKPHQMNVYLKHTNYWMNTFLKPIFKLMDPSQKWEERHPFKSENY